MAPVEWSRGKRVRLKGKGVIGGKTWGFTGDVEQCLKDECDPWRGVGALTDGKRVHLKRKAGGIHVKAKRMNRRCMREE